MYLLLKLKFISSIGDITRLCLFCLGFFFLAKTFRSFTFKSFNLERA